MRITQAFILFCFLLHGTWQAQSTKVTQVEDGDEHLKHHNYLMAIPIYKEELKKTPENSKIKLKLGLCYLNTHLNHKEAVRYLQEAAADKKSDPDVYLYLGMAYHLVGNIEDALLSFEKFKALKPKNDGEVEKYIYQCDNALKLMSKPKNVTFQNLGKEVNSEEPDYYPYTDQDESILIFTTRRKENMGGKKVEVDGYRNCDIYMSKMVNGAWTSARSAGRMLNGNLDDQAVSFSYDALEMLVYEDHIDKFGDLYYTSRKDTMTEFLKPKLMDLAVNEFIETSGCISEDGQVLIFSRREDVNDYSDLYISRKLPTGKWGIPELLPDIINSPYNEENPYLSKDGKTLYFASEGHNSMGGYDLFRSHWDQKTNTFSAPENLGYPINSTDDDKSICMSPDHRFAYVSAFRPGGFGDLDIYRIKFNETEPVLVIYTGQLYLGDTLPASQPNVYPYSISMTNVKNKQNFMFAPHSKTGKFLLAVPEGTYKLMISGKGVARYEEELTITDMGKVNAPRTKLIVLKKLSR